MRAFLNTVKVDLRRSLLSAGFALTVALLFLMQALTFLPDHFSQATVPVPWQHALAMAHWQGIPNMILFLGAICYSWSYCVDKNCGFFDQVIPRVGIQNYCLSRVMVTALSGLLAGALADLLFTLLLLALGLSSELSPHFATQPLYEALAVEGRNGLYLLFRCVHTGMVSAAVAVTALAASTFFKNAYVAIFVPLLLYELTSQISSALNLPRIGIVQSVFLHCFDDQVKSFWYMLCLMLLVIVFFGLVFYRRVKERR